jgi:hypothetical protein
MAEGRINLKSANQNDPLVPREGLEAMAGPAYVLRHHDPGQPHAASFRDQFFRGQAAVGASLVRVDVKVKDGAQGGFPFFSVVRMPVS